LSHGKAKPDEAEASYHRALTIARRQGALWWELRTTVGLARLWREQDKTREARDLLAPIFGGFAEGFDLPDLKDAGHLLIELDGDSVR
jgi:predicted ATPase